MERLLAGSENLTSEVGCWMVAVTVSWSSDYHLEMLSLLRALMFIMDLEPVNGVNPSGHFQSRFIPALL